MIRFTVQEKNNLRWVMYLKPRDTRRAVQEVWLDFISRQRKRGEPAVIRIVKEQLTRQGQWLIREVVDYLEIKGQD